MSVSKYPWNQIVSDLYQHLRLKTTPIGMKLFETVKEMEEIERIRRPQKKHLMDQIVAQAARIGRTVGITADDLPMRQCGAVVGLHPQDELWSTGKPMSGIWFETEKDAEKHQKSMEVVPYGQYKALAVSPLESGRLNPPDICLIYANPAQMILFINGLQWSGFKKMEWSVVGESSCSDSWGKALATGKPSLSIPCYAERRYGGVSDDELLMALSPDDLVKAIEGLKKLSKNGLRYPISSFGVQADPSEVLAPIYPSWYKG